MSTFYEATADRILRFPPLSGSSQADTVIVGGGFAGLATALSLCERGRTDTVLLEAQHIAFGASGRNGGFVSGGFSLDAARLIERLGREEARRLYRLSEEAVGGIRRRIDRYGIDCDVQDGGVLMANWFSDEGPLRELQYRMRDAFDLDWRWLSREETRALLLTDRYHSALHEREAFHFNPLKYALGKAGVLLAQGVRLHEGTAVTAIERDGAGWRVSAPNATVRCRDVVVCCGGYIGGLYRPLSRAAMPIATYVMATEPLGDRLASAMRTTAAVFDTRFAFDYYRPLQDSRILWGGRMSIRERSPQEVERLLGADLLRVYPQLRGVKVTHAWSGLMSYSRHEMPQIGRLPNGLWYAIGFGGHGVAPTTMAGEVLAKALTGEAAIPGAFAKFGLSPTFGSAGKFAAQATYWWMQWMDTVHGWRRRS